MKILIVFGGFFPGKKYGGPPVSVDNFCSLMNEHQCFIVTLDHDWLETKRYDSIHPGWNDRGNCKVLYLPDRDFIKKKFEKTITEITPDIIYLQGVFQTCEIACLQLAKKYKIPVLLAPRGQLCSGAMQIKKYKKIPYIKGLYMVGMFRGIHWHSTSEEETDAIKMLIHADDKMIHQLENIPSIPKKEYLRGRKKSGEASFVFLSRIHPKKNLLAAIELFHNVNGSVSFDIYGPVEDESYWKDCQNEIRSLPDNVKVTYKGLVDHESVHEVFSHYDAFLFPTYSENYGHVIAESMIVGTPVIISDQTPWNDINTAKVGWAIPLQHKHEFFNAINEIVLMEGNDFFDKVKAFAEQKMSLERLKKEYQEVLDQVKGEVLA